MKLRHVVYNTGYKDNYRIYTYYDFGKYKINIYSKDGENTWRITITNSFFTMDYEHHVYKTYDDALQAALELAR